MKLMQLPNTYLRAALAIAVCQLLLACAQPVKNNYISHFGSDAPASSGDGGVKRAAATEGGKPVFPSDPDEQAQQEKKDGDSAPAATTGAQPRIIRGTGKVLGGAKAVAPVVGTPVRLNFEEAPLAQVVRAILGDMLSLDYVLHPPINGTVTLGTRKPIPVDQALNLLETALQANGMAMVRDTRGTYHVGRTDALKAIGASVRQVTSSVPLAPGYGTIIVPLQYIGANEMATILRPMVPGDAIVRIDTVRNLLVMVGSRAQAEGWIDVVHTFDVNLLEGMSVGVFPLKYVTVQEVSAALQLVNGSGGATAATAAVGTAAAAGGGAGAAGVRTQGAAAALGEGNPFFGALRIMPIERLNSILVITPRAAYLDEARRWIAKLDQPGTGGAQPQLNIYRVQNGNAKHLASVLSGIFGGTVSGGNAANSGVAPGLGTSTTASGGVFGSGYGGAYGGSGFGGGFGGSFGNTGTGSGNYGSYGIGGAYNGAGSGLRLGGIGGGQPTAGVATGSAVVANLGGVRVMADELNNSVLVWSTAAEFERIESTLKRLDLPPTQVLIEASIVEVTLNDSLQYGLQWAFSGGAGGNGRTGSGLLSNDSKRQTPGLGEALGQGFSYTLKNSAGAIRAVLSALSSKTNVKVIASPTLMVLDNHTAAIAVGTQQPYLSGTTITTVGSSTNYQYKDTGVNLQVTPSVNAGNLVTMTVNQSVTDVGAKDEVTQQRAFLQRQVASRVAVRSGESIVMGGLIQETSSAGSSGIPFLHDLPVVGSLFGSTNNTGARTELVVIITPRVVRSDVEIREVSEDLRDHMRALTSLFQTPGPAPQIGPAFIPPEPQ